ncbi:single-stranded-DNA-specific exonuclease RecJ [Oceanobacillus chungangensis]|uniref:Single-stranded-DNA-specific exonuclease RecJ n=1 Tax=Oceanobacillus chungangensis TaxID=1229152 RepID=A0A3D8PZS1_9BACI|nr:single-stranded-DNA-specific exonuclease RecJ [Oceanobacillus chungangensis]RDW21690.1 single-stranded-DNA-specific exonuclease RecJ [Oceanobacillus chungangensis]
MLQSKANWQFKPLGSNERMINDLTGITPVVGELLAQRGITTAEAANQFLSPDIKNLHYPINITSIEKAAERVHQAISMNEKVLVFGDYDADGVSSTTVMLKALEELGADCDYYIPNRFTEGYGPNEAAFIDAHEKGYKVIITVDTGIAAVHEASIAKQLGIDLIITDHHEVQTELPDAYAILHPKCSPDYPFDELAGVGVAFKFAEQILGYFPKHLLDLVAIGTIADMVPLVDENRIFAYYGLHALTITKNPGIRALKAVCKIEGNVTEEDVGFLIGPRLNAVGRLQDADLAVQLLMTDDPVLAEEMALEIQGINIQRQEIVNQIVKEAEAMVQDQPDGVIIAQKAGWNEGVLGIVASKLVRKYDRPAIVLTEKQGTNEVKGSARSIPAFDLFKNCMKIRDLFTHFGGHAQAAGMTLPAENVAVIQENLNEFIHEALSEDDFKQVIEVNAMLQLSEINETLVDEINRLAPFGMSNPKPVFAIKEIPADVRQIGAKKNHLKLLFKEDDVQVEGIGFSMGDLHTYITPHTPLTVVGELGINEWNGNRKAQIVLQDMKIEEWQLYDQRGKKKIETFPHINELITVLANEAQPVHLNASQITYETDIEELQKTDVLYIYDLPTNEAQLKEIIQKTKPKNIHVCFNIENSTYLTAFPTREEFIWFYALVLKRKTLDLKQEMQMIMNAKGWTKERIIFISKVFLELGFVKIENGVVHVSPNPDKKDLSEAPSYKERLNQIKIEKELYYSNYEQLKAWFESCMNRVERPKEEVTNGL